MAPHLFIITGASRGLGLALAEQLLRPGHQLLCLSRKTSEALQLAAAQAEVGLEQWPQDLSLGGEAAVRLEGWLAALPHPPLQSATLINNAGMVPHIGPLGELPANDIALALRVGIEAPMQLTAAFLRATQGWDATRRRVLNISSGLGRRPMASQAAYCAAKAALDHFTRCVALEEVLRPNGAQVCALAPGVIDTDMQVQMRSEASGPFPDRARFEQLKHEGLLTAPGEAARQILAYLERADFGSRPVADIREL
ncbi:MAG: SDR family NAD(P)-dependent oxidoreductase [Comamonas sp.]